MTKICVVSRKDTLYFVYNFFAFKSRNLRYVYVYQVLSHAQHSKEGFIREQAELSAKIQEYKRKINQESKWPLSGSHPSSNGDVTQPLPRSSQKEIEAVMQSTSEGKVLRDDIPS